MLTVIRQHHISIWGCGGGGGSWAELDERELDLPGNSSSIVACCAPVCDLRTLGPLVRFFFILSGWLQNASERPKMWGC